jgi:hypothetical protein
MLWLLQLTKVSFGEEFHSIVLEHSESVFESQSPFDRNAFGVEPCVTLVPACKTIFSDSAVAAAIEASAATYCREDSSPHLFPASSPSVSAGRAEVDAFSRCREALVEVLGRSNRHSIAASYRLVQSYLRSNDVSSCRVRSMTCVPSCVRMCSG